MTQRNGGRRKALIAKPYAMVGSGLLTSAIWKYGDEATGWDYRFNLFRMSPTGRIEQRFCATDLLHFVKLIRVLATVLTEDGCLPPARRNELARLAALLDDFRAEDE